MPKLGLSMTNGTIVRWQADDGASVEKGQVLFVLETEKLTVEVEAEVEGRIQQAAPPGRPIRCGEVVGWILAAGEPAAGGQSTGNGATRPAAAAVGSRRAASPAARKLAEQRGVDLCQVSGTGPDGRITLEDVETVAAAATETVADPPPATRVSPVARRLAETTGVDLARVTATGPGGSITKEDVLAAGDRPGPALGDTTVPLGGMRRVIAERMQASLQSMAQLTIGMTAEAGEAVRLAEQLNAGPDGPTARTRLTLTAIVLAATARALRDHPRLNARLDGDEIRLRRDVHLGVAVALDEGLVVPVVRHAGKRPLLDLAAEVRRLADGARAGTLLPDDFADPTFTVTTLGSLGVEFFTPIVNPPNVAILGVGALVDGLGWDGDRPVRRPTVTLSLSFDHRVVDGAPAAAFLAAVRDRVAAPAALLLG
jgi:pyruvate dehydrogenase E2 component (dihydrolipoamide acetyltransferase)